MVLNRGDDDKAELTFGTNCLAFLVAGIERVGCPKIGGIEMRTTGTLRPFVSA
jgi:hypothetical protein